MKFEIGIANIENSQATALLDELSAELEKITGNNGRGSFDNSDINNPRSIFVIAWEDGTAVGCGAFRELSDDIAEVKRMYARKKFCGIGGKVLSYLEEQAKNFGYSTVWLETRKCNEKAVAFYLSHGYKVINNYGKYENRSEAICFEKKLILPA
jgi:ribosomal protein S18 acetylase RimI-like enzyme